MVQAPWWVKGPAAFVAELAPKFGDLPDDQRTTLSEATEQEIRDALTNST